jgi:hypothetical protein
MEAVAFARQRGWRGGDGLSAAFTEAVMTFRGYKLGFAWRYWWLHWCSLATVIRFAVVFQWNGDKEAAEWMWARVRKSRVLLWPPLMVGRSES